MIWFFSCYFLLPFLFPWGCAFHYDVSRCRLFCLGFVWLCWASWTWKYLLIINFFSALSLWIMPFPYLLSSSETPSKCGSDFLILSSISLHFFHIFHILVSEFILDNYFKSIFKNVNSLFNCIWLWFKPILRFSFQLFLEVIMQIYLFPPHIFKLHSFLKNTLNKVILHSVLKSPKLEFL